MIRVVAMTIHTPPPRDLAECERPPEWAAFRALWLPYPIRRRDATAQTLP